MKHDFCTEVGIGLRPCHSCEKECVPFTKFSICAYMYAYLALLEHCWTIWTAHGLHSSFCSCAPQNLALCHVTATGLCTWWGILEHWMNSRGRDMVPIGAAKQFEQFEQFGVLWVGVIWHDILQRQWFEDLWRWTGRAKVNSRKMFFVVKCAQVDLVCNETTSQFVW